jgi:hypothetical protein
MNQAERRLEFKVGPWPLSPLDALVWCHKRCKTIWNGENAEQTQMGSG